MDHMEGGSFKSGDKEEKLYDDRHLGEAVPVAAARHRPVHDGEFAGAKDAGDAVVVVHRLLLGVLHGEVMRKISDQLSTYRTSGGNTIKLFFSMSLALTANNGVLS